MRLPAFLFVIVLIVLLNGCEKTSIQFGQEYVDNGYTNLVLVDSISPVVSTIRKDSVVTAQTGAILTGNYIDPLLGKTTATSYLQLLPSALPELSTNAKYDSLSLLMKSNGSWYGDTTTVITLAVRQLTDELKLQEGQFTFYNTSSFPVSNNTLGTKTVRLRPKSGDSAAIPLNNTMGQLLFNMIRSKSDTLTDNVQFTNYIKGIQISAAANAGAVYGFKDSVIMRVYYHETDVLRQDKYYDLILGNKGLQFNNITADRSGTPLAILNSNNIEAVSDQTGNAGYLQDATGLYLKISFPTIRKLLERTDFVKIIKADLIIQPLYGSNTNNYPLPPQLEAITTDGANEPGSSLPTPVTSTAAQNGNLFIDAIYGTNTNYTYDVTSYLQQQITIEATNKDGLLLLPPAATRFTSLNRLVIADTKGIKSRIRLNLYYVSINK
jgi:hypothetical protein